ncbi:hypothetical protein ABMZ18_23525, partial [Escherichia coli]|uniref:hypothetical protein n=1 Tax=Escherichia coli TaxID=562 RepID=UPI0039BEC559
VVHRLGDGEAGLLEQRAEPGGQAVETEQGEEPQAPDGQGAAPVGWRPEFGEGAEEARTAAFPLRLAQRRRQLGQAQRTHHPCFYVAQYPV